jgi:hypothetical protein
LAGNSYQGGGPSSPIEVIGQLESIGKSRFAVSALEQKARLGINIFGLNSVAGASGKTLVQFVSEALDERKKEHKPDVQRMADREKSPKKWQSSS